MPTPHDLRDEPPAAFWGRLAAGSFIPRLLDLAFDEDLGSAGDVTSLASIDPGLMARAHLVMRSGGVLAGLVAAPLVVGAYERSVSRRGGHAGAVRVSVHAADGQHLPPQTAFATLTGSARDLLAIERTLLNLVGRLSGIATRTAAFVQRLAPQSRARVYDTRKTTPGLRVLEKYAVRCGGGFSHRLGLHDALLIKDNHLAGVGDARLAEFVQHAVGRARAMAPLEFVEVEVDRLSQFEALLTLPRSVVDIVLLDNMGPPLLREAAGLRDARAPWLELESSGGITLDTIAEVSATGVDRISIGGLTHQAVSVDVALDFEGGA